MKKIVFLLLSFGLFAAQVLQAQCLDNRWETLDANQVSALYNNGANKFWDMHGVPAYEVPRGTGLKSSFASALWIGGLDAQDQLHLAASTYRQQGWDWYVGPTRNQPANCIDEITTTGEVMLHGIHALSNGDILILTTNEVVIYDPVTRTTLHRTLPNPRAWIDALELPDGRIFLFGDYLYPTKFPVLFMDTATYTIAGGPPLHWFHRESTIDLLDDGRVLLAGVVGCEVFNPATNLSSPVPDMLWPRTKHATAHLPNGNIMAFGGGQGVYGSGSTTFTQYFDDSLGYWFPGPNMNVGRQRVRATTMPDGKIFISGGTEADSTTQIYDPLLDTFYVAAPLPIPVNVHHVSVYDSTTVLITAVVNGLFYLYQFDINTGEYQEMRLQRAGAAHFLMGQEEILLPIEDNWRLGRFDLKTQMQMDNRWQHVWKVDRAQVDAFRTDFQNGQVDFDRYPQIAVWPAHGDEGLGEDRNLAPFVDVNGDGRYEPALDGDYPCILGDQSLWMVYNDVGSHQESGGQPLGVQVEVMAYAIDCDRTPCPDTALDYTTFLHYEVTNQSSTAYHDLHLGEFDDVDLGNYSDDFFASDSSLRLAIGYNGDDLDNGYYGVHPPAWGATVLPNGQLDMQAAMNFENSFGSPNSSPNSPEGYYSYLMGRFLDSLPIVNNGRDGYPGTAPGAPTHYMYSSTDGFCGGGLSGWSEFSAGNQAFDRRFVYSSTAFDLQPGESIQWDIAFVFARDSSNLASVCALKSATATVRDWWQNQLDKSCFNTVVAVEQPQESREMRIIPNPVAGSAFTVDFGEALADASELELIDLQGRVLQRMSLDAGSARAQVDATRLPAGVYLVRVMQPSGARVQRVVVW